ncbi:MAG: hypothetical protein ACR2NR_22825 [Solirubrobacteraceae bacterium]
MQELIIACSRARRRRPPSPWPVWVIGWYAALLGMVGSAVYHLARHRGGPVWIFAAVFFAVQTMHVHHLYLHAIRRAEHDQPTPVLAPGQWLLLTFAATLMLLSFVT